MDLLDVVSQRAGIDPEIVYQLREEFGGQTHYVRSARTDRHLRIRQDLLPSRLLAQRYKVTPRTIKNILNH
jgi:hypothetical protein